MDLVRFKFYIDESLAKDARVQKLLSSLQSNDDNTRS